MPHTLEPAPGRRSLALPIVVGIAGLVIGILAASFTYDDAWITYRYAANVAAGNGLVYNVGERVFGTTAPGYAMLIGFLSIPNPEWVPTVSAGLCVLSLAACGVAFQVFGSRRDMPLAGFVAALYFMVNPLALETFGGEMVPQAALALWGVTALALDRPLLATACGLGATMIRPDGIVALLLILGWQAWHARAVPWRSAALAAVVMALWFGGLWLYFGTPMPDTLAAKQAQRMSGLWHSLGTDLVLWLLSLTAFPTPFMGPRPADGFTTFLALALVGLAVVPFRRRWWMLAAWPILVLLAYRQMRLPFYHWYAVPPLALLVLAAGLAADASSRALAWLVTRVGGTPTAVAQRAAAIAVGGVIAVVSVVPMARHAARTREWYPGPGETAYMRIGDWLARETPPDATIGYLEVGFIGYRSHRRIVDPFGLVTAGAGQGIARRDFLYAYRTHRPDFILFHPAHFPKELGILVDQPWFQAEYAPVASLPSAIGTPITVYRRTVPRPPG